MNQNPINQMYYIVDVPLAILTIVFAAISLLLVVSVLYGELLNGKTFLQRISITFATLFSLGLTIGGMSWWISSANTMPTVEISTYHEIKDVVFPDGSKVQMFTCDGIHHNVTSMWGKVIDNKVWHVHRVRWSPIRKYVYYTNGSRENIYTIETRDGNPLVESPPTDPLPLTVSPDVLPEKQ